MYEILYFYRKSKFTADEMLNEYKVLFTSNVTLVDELFTDVPPKNGFEKRCQSIFNKYNPYCLGPFQSLNKGSRRQGVAG